jgi:hypothetical protein
LSTASASPIYPRARLCRPTAVAADTDPDGHREDQPRGGQRCFSSDGEDRRGTISTNRLALAASAQTTCSLEPIPLLWKWFHGWGVTWRPEVDGARLGRGT